jgi:hypothetical protein
VVKYSELSKTRTLTIFRMIEIDDAVIWKKNFVVAKNKYGRKME